ncbi:transcription factor HES-2-like [Scleropages formosus]|uniref:Transcription factor HES-2-like n=1 Tax=Scleropages formosus TaxID=113540 RepID=A0A0P7WCK4_SCLFO|nr:transcription factor HES-2-like [Scleropages formosus]
MTPSIIMNPEMSVSCLPRTVAQRKEANELRKNSRYSKLEKADILEMTVSFLRDLPSAPSKSPSDSYREGYKACLQRVSTLLPKTNLLDADTSRRLNEYIQQAMTPCQSCRCSSQTSRSAPQRNPPSLGFVKAEKPQAAVSSGTGGPHVHTPQPRPQTLSANMWRPW